MNGKAPFEKLKELGHDLPQEFALFPPVILDTVSTNFLLETGNDLLAQYTPRLDKFNGLLKREQPALIYLSPILGEVQRSSHRSNSPLWYRAELSHLHHFALVIDLEALLMPCPQTQLPSQAAVACPGGLLQLN